MSKISSVSVSMRLCTTNRNENENDNENEAIWLIIMKMKTIMKNRSHDETSIHPEVDIDTNTLNI